MAPSFRNLSSRITLEIGQGADYLVSMGDVFVPYIGDKPAAVEINGHKLIIISTESQWLEDSLAGLGGDHVERLSSFDTRAELRDATDEFAKTLEAGVIIAPVDVRVEELIENLELQLPWIQ